MGCASRRPRSSSRSPGVCASPPRRSTSGPGSSTRRPTATGRAPIRSGAIVARSDDQRPPEAGAGRDLPVVPGRERLPRRRSRLTRGEPGASGRVSAVGTIRPMSVRRIAVFSHAHVAARAAGHRRRRRHERVRPGARDRARPRRRRMRRLHARRAPRRSRRSCRSSRASASCTSRRGRARRCRSTTLPELVEPFVDASMRRMLEREPVDVLHANYWLSGAVAHRLKHELDLPLVATFHTLARVKAEAGVDDDSEHRTRVEHEVIACADLMLASTDDERDAARLALRRRARPHRGRAAGCRPHRVLPGDRGAARQRLGIDAPPVLLFVGRIQPLKGADLAIRALAALDDPKVALVIVGGPSGRDGPRRAGPGARARRRARRRPPDPLGQPPPPRSPRRLLPRRRRVHRAVALGVVRAGRAGSGRVRNAGRRRGGRRSALARRRRAHRVPRRGPRPGRLRGAGRAAARRRDPRGRDGCQRGGAVEALLVEHDRRAAPPALRRSRRRAVSCAATES